MLNIYNMERSLKNVVKEVYKNSDNNGSFKFQGNNRDKLSNTSETINVSLKNKNNNNGNGKNFLSKAKDRLESYDSNFSNSSYIMSFLILIILFMLVSMVLGVLYIYYDKVMTILRQYFYDDTKEKELTQKFNEESQKLNGEISSLKTKLNESNQKSKSRRKKIKKTYGDLKETDRKVIQPGSIH